MDWAMRPEVREGLYAAIQQTNFIGDDTGCGGLDRIGFPSSHWWFESIYKAIQPLALTQRNNSRTSLKLRAIVSSSVQRPLLDLFCRPRQISAPNLTRLPITRDRRQLAAGVVLGTHRGLERQTAPSSSSHRDKSPKPQQKSPWSWLS